MKIEIGKRYFIYGKMDDMKNMKPISDGSFTNRLIFADMFLIDSEDTLEKFQKELDNLNTQGEFEPREAKW